MNDTIHTRRDNSPLFSGNAPFIEDLYEQFLVDAASVPSQWRRYFEQIHGAGDTPHSAIRQAFASHARQRPATTRQVAGMDPAAAEKQKAVLQLINAYRVRGHQNADIDPLKLRDRPYVPDLDLAAHNLGDEDMDLEFNSGSLVAPERMPLRDILAFLRKVYCGHVGVEYMHITDTDQKRWLQNRIEGECCRPAMTREARVSVLERLTAAEGLEKYLHKKYVGQKRFSLEGGESLIPLLNELIQRGGSQNVAEVVLGMTHRGRLNVLVNILGKSPKNLFEEFEGKTNRDDVNYAGDVKYHQGFSSDINTPGGPVHIALSFNPSHLEVIDPVVQGSVRARQQRRHDRAGDLVMPVLLHGDAAFAGQGVVMETFNMSQARGFHTGGTVHIVVNNQVGFTTSHPKDVRSSYYSTDVAKMVQAPIFHVNADDPEAVVYAAQVALDFRMTFKRDVVIDLICYRRHGHNEADEPAVTQPMMYQKIKNHPTARHLYAERLINEGILSQDDVSRLENSYRDTLETREIVAHRVLTGAHHELAANWARYRYEQRQWTETVDTTLPLATIRDLADRLDRSPAGFVTHPRVAKLLEERRKMAAGALPVDWGFAENLAYASLVTTGRPVRLCGQDTGRGTFFHRHVVLHNQKDGIPYVPLQYLSDDQANFTVIDSLLSEEGVLGFEYGYSTAEPEALVIWEAQYGDFANGAQVIIDQFISSGEAKWGRYCGLTLFLPHGHEGQGAEHSSARLERWLQLCADENIQICVPTTPAQMFHMLRRQVLRPYRKPLAVMTPKSLLRRKLATSTLEALSTGGFQSVIREVDDLDPDQIKRVVVCSGKVYYDLLEERRNREQTGPALVRVEQLYPFPEQDLADTLATYPNATEIVWCQEEPKNQGAWYQIRHRLQACLTQGQQLGYAGRRPSAAPAPGSFGLHVEQQKTLVDEALAVPQKESDRARMSAARNSA